MATPCLSASTLWVRITSRVGMSTCPKEVFASSILHFRVELGGLRVLELLGASLRVLVPL